MGTMSTKMLYYTHRLKQKKKIHKTQVHSHTPRPTQAAGSLIKVTITWLKLKGNRKKVGKKVPESHKDGATVCVKTYSLSSSRVFTTNFPAWDK